MTIIARWRVGLASHAVKGSHYITDADQTTIIGCASSELAAQIVQEHNVLVDLLKKFEDAPIWRDEHEYIPEILEVLQPIPGTGGEQA